MEGNDVSSFGKFNDDRILEALGVVVLSQFQAQAPGLDPNHGINLRIEVIGAAENLRSDLILLNWRAGVIERVSSQITKKLAQRFRAVEMVTGDQSVDLGEKGIPIIHKRNPLHAVNGV